MSNAEARLAFMIFAHPLKWVDFELWLELVTKLALATDEEIYIVYEEATNKINELIETV